MLRIFGCLSLLLGVALGLSGSGYAQQAQRTGVPVWVWLLILVVLLAFFSFVIWWWGRGKEREREAPAPKVRAPEVRVEAPAVSAEPPKVELPKVEAKLPSFEVPAVPDDLKVIEGIGPKIASVLNSAGILTFAQLAAANADHIREILEKADPRLLRLADPATWPEQAKHAAAGDWDALRTLQDTLRGGRRA